MTSSLPLDIYTDGSCYPNPGGPGGWAWAISPTHYRSGYAASTTNNRMELCGVFAAIKHNEGPLNIYSDSQYVVRGLQGSWRKWAAKDWKIKGGKDRPNVDLWIPLTKLVEERGNVTFTWVRGHDGDPMNELADELCGRARIEEHGEECLP